MTRISTHGFIRRSTLMILVASLAAGLGLWAAQPLLYSKSKSPPAMAITTLLPSPRTIPAFALLGAGDEPLTLNDLEGRWTLVFIGFTHCPDVCPTTLADLGGAAKLWAKSLPAAQQPQILFVSVDPERDSPDRTQEYARFFSPDAIGVTGDLPALEAFTRSLGMVFMKAPVAAGTDPANYSIDHSAHITLLDPQGRFAGLIRAPHAPAAIANDLIAIVQSTP
ncbi:MAG: SCO family protein [Xanthomonadaceae bacterium]|nr:SCO family protein [Xanthomonadaceae bacterium]MDP2185315.1 SCO family protein [Xanthomonadales bacterium]MDZ4115853.1 SCO family protein [Xanthomonadaceae bacterium]MDZ4378683.1 SCO family protein [Xanthomonadaceae bacterium]